MNPRTVVAGIRVEPSDDARAVRRSTFLAWATWIAIALLILFVRDGSWVLTVLALGACVIALFVVVKDEVVKPEWILTLNIIVAILPMIFLLLLLLTAQTSMLGPFILAI